jgi:hypothetical protein
VAPVRRATPDQGRIRTWNADDHEAREKEAFERKSRTQQYREAVAAWVERHRLANDPEVWAQLAEQQLARGIAEQH